LVGKLGKSMLRHCGRTHNRFRSRDRKVSATPGLLKISLQIPEILLNQFASRKGPDKDLCGKQGLKSEN